MKIIYNTLIPFRGFKAINLFGILFARKGAKMDERTLNHERIHTAQIKELLWLIFYGLYLFEWILRLIEYRNTHEAYRNISFEREAFDNDENLAYLDERKPFAFIRYSKQQLIK